MADDYFCTFCNPRLTLTTLTHTLATIQFGRIKVLSCGACSMTSINHSVYYTSTSTGLDYRHIKPDRINLTDVKTTVMP